MGTCGERIGANGENGDRFPTARKSCYNIGINFSVEEKMTRHKTFRLVVDALLMAIVLLQNILPFLGYIPLGPFSMTLIGLTVIVAGTAMGPKDGMLIGGFWG